jgi:hypothetical protein
MATASMAPMTMTLPISLSCGKWGFRSLYSSSSFTSPITLPVLGSTMWTRRQTKHVSGS